MTALEYAKEMASKHPDRSDRREVLRLLELLVSWGEAKKSAGTQSQLREDHLSPESHPMSLVDGSSPTAIHTHPTEDASALTALKGSVDSLKEEITSLKTQVDELKMAVRGHNTLLECLERAVTLSSEKLTSLNEHVEALLPTGAAANPPPPINNQRMECIEAMMAKTDVFEGIEDKVLSFRRIYEYLYDQGNFTASLLLFLARKPHFKAIVDCDDSHISRIRPEFKHKSWSNYDTYNGRELSTQDWSSFADFPTSKVYLGGKIDESRKVENVASIFARTLTQMVLYMIFKNKGMPYKSNDIYYREKFNAAFQEAEVKRMSCGELDINIVVAMTERERMIEFIPIVPSMIAFKGSTAGIPLLREQVPLLLKLYEDHVIPKLLAQA
ncbi:uncharacterized protein LOC124172722 [Ischnura elegans]|uniref:uncharacterized protein LOC124172722 n=1 Tax=Ischnura elegans TaxID=197161 RepID=UPI001ED8A49E|nr:uncharacterized protein LOC124172722 [Ischnura elegans]XP_046408149.1 uncharacterized protein LOC124172722 [Ischnura elegans]XP_046408150.1 uncharacterized protein LOC124172722 [Ischnura elegans]